MTPQPVHDCPLCHNNPGSDTAREQGCQCPVLDNEHGHTNRVVVNLGCLADPALRSRREFTR